jgi:hypothetical protein
MSTIQKYNGRVNIVQQPNTDTLFSLHSTTPINNKTTDYRDALQGGWENSTLSLMYFNAKNISTLQYGIKAGVYNRSSGKYVISNQDEDTLKIIMRSIYLSNAKNKPTDLAEQVQVLNQLVLNYCIPQVFGEAQGYTHYLEDVSTLVVPMDRPILTDVRNKTLSENIWL